MTISQSGWLRSQSS